MIQSMRAILAGGGTGGHVIPALAIANELKKSYGAEVLFIGTARGIENRLVPAAGYPLLLVRGGALKNGSLATRLKAAFILPRAGWRLSQMWWRGLPTAWWRDLFLRLRCTFSRQRNIFVTRK